MSKAAMLFDGLRDAEQFIWLARRDSLKADRESLDRMRPQITGKLAEIERHLTHIKAQLEGQEVSNAA